MDFILIINRHDTDRRPTVAVISKIILRKKNLKTTDVI